MTSQSPDRDPFRVLFVCTGNTCRSPMAEALARRELEAVGLEGVEVGSAGAAATDGAPASAGARRAAEDAGLDLSAHRSRPLTPELVDWADLVLVMSPSHLGRVAELGGGDRVALLGSFAEGGEGAAGPSVPDPFGGTDEVYRATLRSLEELVSRALRRLRPPVTE